MPDQPAWALGEARGSTYDPWWPILVDGEKIGEVWSLRRAHGYGAKDNDGFGPSCYDRKIYGDLVMDAAIFSTIEQAVEALLRDRADPNSIMSQMKAGEEFPMLKAVRVPIDPHDDPAGYWA